MNSLGERLRNLRENQGLLLRQAAAFIEVDTAFLSKVERGEKRVNREQVIKLAEFLHTDKEQLIIFWLCDKIISVISDDPMGKSALKLASEKTTTTK